MGSLVRSIPLSSSRSIVPRCLAAVSVLAFLGACGPGGDVEIELVRRAPSESAFAKVDASSQERFGGGSATPHDHAQPVANPFVWETPEGWVELEPQQFREINLRPGGHPELECYLTVLQGTGGGLAANVDRWRNQLGLEPMAPGDLEALPPTLLFGRPASRVELVSEGDDARALWGVILESSGMLVTVKLTGPVALVEEQRASFDYFIERLAIRVESAAPTTTASHPPPESGLGYEMPEGWTDVGASDMRLVNLRTPGSSQCYVIRLAGQAGGLLNNLNRWRSEVGLGPLESAELDALPKVDLLGRAVSLLEVSGEYRGMGDMAGPGKTLLGVALIGNESSLFVKMVGPEADVAAERERFIEFLGSVVETKG
jgi:hypothetical protein